MPIRRPVQILAAVAAATALLVAVPHAAAPVRADDDQIEVPVVSPLPQPGTIVFNPLGDLSSITGVTVPGPGCVSIATSITPASNSLCTGQPLGAGDPPLTVTGANPTAPGSSEARRALGWLVDEAIEAIRAMHDVPLDERIGTYAAAEIRAYVHNRITDIMDRYVFGETLTEDERRTLDFVQQAVLEADRQVTRAAYEEYRRWQDLQCTYTPPPAPAFVAEPVRLPDDVRNWCQRRHNFYDVVFVFAPPQPSAEHFQAWGAYRNAAELGLTDLSEAEAQEALARTIAAGAVLGGIATAIGAAVATSAVVGSSVTLATAVASAMGASATLPAAVTAFGPALVSTMISATAAAAAASVVAIVVVAVVVTAIAIWQIIEHEKVGQTIVERMQQAEANTDPFGLEPLREMWKDLELRSAIDPDDPPAYRNQQNQARLAHLVTMWLATDASGGIRPDPVGVWDDNATTPRDYRFEVSVDGADPVVADSIRVPSSEGRLEVRFNRSWMIVTPEGGTPRAALWFRFTDADGEPAMATRAAHPQGGWVVASAKPGGGLDGMRTPHIRYRDDEGREVRAWIVAPEKPLAGPYPTVVGPLIPGRVHNLRPNPVSEDGSFGLARYRTDYSYQWTVHRFDPDAGAWAPVGIESVEDGYGARFTPTEVGEYRAVVTMTDLVDPAAPPQSGVVQFRVSPPEIRVERLELVDNGEDELVVHLKLAEDVVDDDLEVAVRWPGEFDAEPPTSAVTLECLGATPLTCATVDTEEYPSLRSALTHRIGFGSDLSRGVTVTVRNSFGGVLERVIPIDHPGRPRLAPPATPPAAGQFGTVQVAGNVISVQLVAEADGPPNYQLATVMPGQGSEAPAFGLRDESGQFDDMILLGGNDRLVLTFAQDAGGEWGLWLHALPTFDDVGVSVVPLLLRQSNHAELPFLVRLEVVPTPEARYRGVLVNAIDRDDITVDRLPRLDPQVLGGRVEWDDVAGEFCVSIRDTALPDPAQELCRPVDEVFGPDGAPSPFPFRDFFPSGVPSGRYQVRAWLNGESGRAWPAEPESHVYDGAHVVPFRLTVDPPRITTLEWDGGTRVLRLAVDPGGPTAPISAVRCRLDGAATPCWSAAGGNWVPPSLTEGAHRLEVEVDDAAGNFTAGSLEFTVAAATGGGNAGGGGNGGGSGSGGRPGGAPGGSGGDGAVAPGTDAGTGDDPDAAAGPRDDDSGTGGSGDRDDPGEASDPAPPAPEAGTPDAADGVVEAPWPTALLWLLVVVLVAGVAALLLLLLARRRAS